MFVLSCFTRLHDECVCFVQAICHGALNLTLTLCVQHVFFEHLFNLNDIVYEKKSLHVYSVLFGKLSMTFYRWSHEQFGCILVFLD